jgi:hypothetical protein
MLTGYQMESLAKRITEIDAAKRAVRAREIQFHPEVSRSTKRDIDLTAGGR